jgi:hypothetical protein
MRFILTLVIREENKSTFVADRGLKTIDMSPDSTRYQVMCQ